jgi:hypothetical protein
MSNIDQTMRGLERASAKVKERRAKERVEQQEIQAAKDKLQQQQQLLALADLKAQIEVFQNADNGVTTKTTIDANSTTDKISDEQYQQTITGKMINHIHKRKQHDERQD